MKIPCWIFGIIACEFYRWSERVDRKLDSEIVHAYAKNFTFSDIQNQVQKRYYKYKIKSRRKI
ncbi:MAG: hypothetical protein AAY43_10160 [Methanosarcina sp. 795]|jgi:hypothetical protein|nr:MAG: hypothetical protein AAY43_10160 [Methanosarcina sp. 795]